MAIKGVSVVEEWDYVSKLDQATDDADKTFFVLGAIDMAVRSHIGDTSTLWVSGPDGTDAIMNKASTRNVEAVRFGLRGFRNFKNERGDDIEYKTVKRYIGTKEYLVVSDDTLQQIPSVIIAELGDEILAKNTLSEDMRKKFKTP